MLPERGVARFYTGEAECLPHSGPEPAAGSGARGRRGFGAVRQVVARAQRARGVLFGALQLVGGDVERVVASRQVAVRVAGQRRFGGLLGPGGPRAGRGGHAGGGGGGRGGG